MWGRKEGFMRKFSSIKEFRDYQPDAAQAKVEILIGMGTCGIASGADKVLKTLQDQTASTEIENIEIKKVGCLGFCFSEPNVEVRVEGMPNVLYGKVTETFAKRILEEHILKGNIINENIFDIPFIDILK